MMDSRSFWGMSPCMADTVKLASTILFRSQSTFLRVLQKITAWRVWSDWVGVVVTGSR